MVEEESEIEEKVKLAQILRKYNEDRIKYFKTLRPLLLMRFKY